MNGGPRFSGSTLDGALSGACVELGARVGELHYEIVEEDNGGPENVVVEAVIDPLAVLGLFLAETMGAGALDVKARIADQGEVLSGELSGSDVRVLTAGGGKGLDALQYLCNRVLNRRLADHAPLHLDSDGFKDRRAARLRDKALEAADEVRRDRRSVMLGPLTPAARREVHLALVDEPGVETESHGRGFLKRVVVRSSRRR